MEMTGEHLVPASRAAVWEALNDADVLRQCIPGCTALDKVSDTELLGKSVLKIGPIKATFSGRVLLSDISPEQGYTISGEGQGGVAGFAKGGAQVWLEDADDATKMSYRAKADIGGKLAQLGSRLIDSTAKKLADEFFQKFVAVVSANSNAARITTQDVAVARGMQATQHE